jgi:serralysin
LATVTFFSAVNMADTTTQSGSTTVTQANLLRIENNSDPTQSTLRQDYTGSFEYSGSTLIGGTITGFGEYTRAVPTDAYTQTWGATGLNADAVKAFTALNSSVQAFQGVLFAGNDTFTGSSGNDVMLGFVGNDAMNGGNGNDNVKGGDGADLLNGGAGDDVLNGGTGMLDFGQYSAARSNYTITREGMTTTVSSTGEGTDTLTKVEHLQFSDITIDLGANGPRHFDSNGDGHTDVLWQNTNGTIGLWSMNGAQLSGGGNLGSLLPGWNIVDLGGDYNGDGKSDILFRSSGNAIAAWELNGTTLAANGNIGQTTAAWHIVSGAGDYNGDGKSDILWRNDDGTIAEWQMNGLNVTGGGNVAATTSSWQIIDATGDHNGDGKSDVLFKNDNGTLAVWNMNGTAIAGGGNIGVANPGWHVIDTHGDYNGDGKADILWRNDDGTIATWLLNGNTIIGGGNVAQSTSAWDVVAGSGDYNGDGKSDILFRNTDGTIGAWLMNGTTVAAGGSGNIAVAGQGWNIANAALDYTGDGKSDILWQNDSGQVAVWQMNGLQIAGGGNSATSTADWALVG